MSKKKFIDTKRNLLTATAEIYRQATNKNTYRYSQEREVFSIVVVERGFAIKECGGGANYSPQF